VKPRNGIGKQRLRNLTASDLLKIKKFEDQQLKN